MNEVFLSPGQAAALLIFAGIAAWMFIVHVVLR